MQLTESDGINWLKFITGCYRIVFGAARDFQERANDVVNVNKPEQICPIAYLNRQTATNVLAVQSPQQCCN